MTGEPVKFFNADGTETLTTLTDAELTAQEAEDQVSTKILALLLFGTVVVICSSLVAMTWIITNMW